MTKKYSDFKIISITLIGALLFFTLNYFRFFPLHIFHISTSNLSNAFNTYYFILTEVIALILSYLFVAVYIKKNDKELKQRYKSIAIGLSALLLYFILPYFESIPFALFNVSTKEIPLELTVIYLIAYLMLTTSIIVFIYRKKIEQDFKTFKKNILKNISNYLKYWFIALGIMMFSNLIINLFITNSLATNEQAVRETLSISPLYVFISAVICAPILEELIFRLSIKNIFSNKELFIIISGLLFGSLHAFNNYQNLTDLLYIIPYSAPGFIFAYMLYKSDNIFVPISFHFIHNGILVILQMLLLFR